MKINVGRSVGQFVESLGVLLELLPTCQHEDRTGCYSFDTARGDPFCFNIATVERLVKYTSWRDERRKYCEQHKKWGDTDLSHALAYRRLRAVVNTTKRRCVQGKNAPLRGKVRAR